MRVNDIIKNYGIKRFSRESEVDMTFISRFVNMKRTLPHKGKYPIKIVDAYRRISKLPYEEAVNDFVDHILSFYSYVDPPKISFRYCDCLKGFKSKIYRVEPKNPGLIIVFREFLKTDLTLKEMKEILPGFFSALYYNHTTTWDNLIRCARVFNVERRAVYSQLDYIINRR